MCAVRGGHIAKVAQKRQNRKLSQSFLSAAAGGYPLRTHGLKTKKMSFTIRKP